MSIKKLYLSLDEAREEILKRWQNTKLKKEIESELGKRFMPIFKETPRGVLFRVLCSPDNGFAFFQQCAKYINTEPLVLEYLDDIFVHFNDEKKGLGRLRMVLKDDTKAFTDIMDFHANEKRKLNEISIKTGQGLVDFHHNLFKMFGYKIDLHDNSKWFHSIGRASDYYYFLLLHFVAHGILLETFLNEGDEHEDAFTNTIIIPAIEKITKKYNFSPIVVKLYPENQSALEDFYWWCYPPNINEYITGYSQKNKLPAKKINI